MGNKASFTKALAHIGADSVYMLLHKGWHEEARSNRWHFATRWARHLPVVLVCPETVWPRGIRKAEDRIKNCRILEVPSNFGPVWGDVSQLQVAQILADMRASGAKRPLLWLYNAYFTEAFAVLPAIARVHHVTENYFDYQSWPPAPYLERIKFVSSIADLNVAVSEGCAKPLEEFVQPGRILVATNGCDFADYGQPGPPDPEALSLRESFRRLAVYGGNINERIDFDLVRRLADASCDTRLLFVGANKLGPAGATEFSELLARPNVSALGAVDPDRLPSIYRAADLGFIPFVRDKLISENGFPLKTLEMAATGLPVVSTLMRPLLPHSPPLAVTTSNDEFVAAFLRAEREPLLSSTLRELARANDYDSRFATIVEHLASLSRHQGSNLGSLVRSFPNETAAVLQNALLRDGQSLRHIYNFVLPDIREKILARILAVLDLLPSPARRLIRRVKRGVFGGPRVAE